MSIMNEEEKKAIEYLETRLDILHNNTQWATEKSIKTVLNLIEKQQKEIYKLNRKQADDEMLNDTFIERDYISRNKIREKIKYIKNLTFEENLIIRNYILTILEELLEED